MQVLFYVLADILVVVGLVIMTIGVYGVLRFPDVYTRLHAASKAVFLGVIAFLLAVSLTSGPDVILRSALISFLLLMTTPVAAHVIAQAAFRDGQPMRTPGATDESRQTPHGDESD